jgi:hypothetical protein
MRSAGLAKDGRATMGCCTHYCNRKCACGIFAALPKIKDILPGYLVQWKPEIASWLDRQSSGSAQANRGDYYEQIGKASEAQSGRATCAPGGGTQRGRDQQRAGRNSWAVVLCCPCAYGAEAAKRSDGRLRYDAL